MSCSKCEESLLSEDAISCVLCAENFHYNCVGMAEKNFRRMNKTTLANWKCITCKTGDGQASMKDEIRHLFSDLRSEMREEAGATRRELGGLISGLSEKIDSCIEKYESLNTRFDELKVDFDAKLKVLGDRVDSLEGASRPYGHSSNIEMETTFAEFDDRRRRAQNVIIYDFPESSSPDGVIAMEEDLANLKSSLSQLSPQFDGLVLRLSRLGTRRSDRVRPLKVVLDSPSSVTKLLVANRSAQPPILSASSDKTLRQRQFLGELRAELKRRLDSGEQDLTIRYINGVPSIVSSSASRPSNRNSKNL